MSDVTLTVTKCWGCPLSELEGDGRGNRWEVCHVTREDVADEGVLPSCPLLKGPVTVKLSQEEVM